MEVIVEKIHSGNVLQLKSGNRWAWQRYNPLYWNFKIGDDVSRIIGRSVRITITDTNKESVGYSRIIRNGKTVLLGGLPLRRRGQITEENIKDKILLTK